MITIYQTTKEQKESDLVKSLSENKGKCLEQVLANRGSDLSLVNKASTQVLISKGEGGELRSAKTLFELSRGEVLDQTRVP